MTEEERERRERVLRFMARAPESEATSVQVRDMFGWTLPSLNAARTRARMLLDRMVKAGDLTKDTRPSTDHDKRFWVSFYRLAQK